MTSLRIAFAGTPQFALPALRALLDTRKDRLKVIFTGSSEDRLRTMFGAEDKAFYN